jgi:tRNA(adenine34) deaminase
MNQALELAQKAADQGEVPVGAIVVHAGKVIGRGYNLRENAQNPIAHAEVLALQDAAKSLGSWRLLDCTLIVTLEPCPMCLSACQQARVANVFYGAVDPKGGALSLGYKVNEDVRTNHRFPVTHLPDARCGEILRAFFSKKRGKSDQADQI